MTAPPDENARPVDPKVDEALRRQRERFEPVLEISPSAIIITDLDGGVVAWNRAAERLFGYSAGEAIGRPINDLVARRKELRDEADQLDRMTDRGAQAGKMTQRTRKDGSLVDVDIVGGAVTVGDEVVGKHV